MKGKVNSGGAGFLAGVIAGGSLSYLLDLDQDEMTQNVTVPPSVAVGLRLPFLAWTATASTERRDVLGL